MFIFALHSPFGQWLVSEMQAWTPDPSILTWKHYGTCTANKSKFISAGLSKKLNSAFCVYFQEGICTCCTSISELSRNNRVSSFFSFSLLFNGVRQEMSNTVLWGFWSLLCCLGVIYVAPCPSALFTCNSCVPSTIQENNVYQFLKKTWTKAC